MIDAGFERVFALENGTMAWQFEGLDLEHGNHASLPEPDKSSMLSARGRARQMARKWHIERIDSIPLQGARSRYLIDVRTLPLESNKGQPVRKGEGMAVVPARQGLVCPGF